MKSTALALIFLFSLSVSANSKAEKNKPAKLDVSPITRQLADAKQDRDQCMRLFERGRDLMKKLVQKNKSAYPSILRNDLNSAIRSTRVSCVNKTIEPYGYVLFRSEKSMMIEQEFASFSKIVDGPIGQIGMSKFEIIPRLVMLDHLLAGIALHAYAEVIGLDDNQFDLFFQMLKHAQATK
jgi:hypothetical protein